MCPVFFSKKPPVVCGSILVRDHRPLATIKSAHFGWSLSGGSTVDSFSSSSVASVGTCFGSWIYTLRRGAGRWYNSAMNFRRRETAGLYELRSRIAVS